MDRASLREGGVVRLWVSELGEEVIYEQDLPACCRRDSRGSEEAFECFVCGARWQAVVPVETEECAFMERAAQERKGAA
ncbi:MAG: hypothetical protein WA982_11780 [Rubrobacteraceae bacterium]